MELQWHEYAAIGGVIIVVIAFIWWKFKDDIMFNRQSRETEGIISNWMSGVEKGKQYFYPLIEFVTENGERVNYRAEERSEGKPLYSVGTKVRVRYLPKDPKNVRTIYPKA
ncbi:MAG: DUF3592 domain-containing protein [Flavobacteriales bacterium]|nr:DUF3592 domain-containing protein [Flavobacteriales bacterium]